jgi:hypothetical protein
MLSARLGKGRPGPILGTWIGGLVLCVAPAVFAILFGPILFAFLYGNR